MRKLLVVLALCLALPVFGSAQSVNYYPSGSGSTALLPTTYGTWTTAGTSEVVVYTVTIPAGTLPSRYGGVTLRLCWQKAANANSTTMQVRVGGIGGSVVAARTIANSGERGYAELNLMASSSNTLTVGGYGVADTVSYTSFGGTYVTSLTFSSPITLDVTLTTGTQAGDLTLTSVSAELLK